MKTKLFLGVHLCSLLVTSAFALDKPAAQTAKVSTQQSQQNASLSARTQAQMAALIGRDNPAYHIQSHAGGFRMASKTSNVTGEFMADRAMFKQQDSSWGMTLRGIGYGEKLQALQRTQPQGRKNRVEYRRGRVTEWYANGPLGIEQGFTIDKAPGASNGKPLTLTMALSGNVTPALDSERQGLMLAKNGIEVLRYAGLTAWDAQGRTLPSWLELSGDQLRVNVHDEGAAYPITIDPYIQAVKLTTAKQCSFGGSCDDGSAETRFGWSVAMSGNGNVAVIGAAGRAYVFVKPPVLLGGWNSIQPIYYAARLQPANATPETVNFGRSVAIDMTGSTIAVGSPAGALRSMVFMFLKPENGWGDPPVQWQIATLTANTPVGLESDMGYSLAMTPDGSAVVAGAPLTSVYPHWRQGAVYYFHRHPSLGWVSMTQSQMIYPSTGGALDSAHFGRSVSMSDDSFLILGGTHHQRAIMFDRYGRQLVEFRRAVPDNVKFAGTGVVVSGDGTTVALSASGCQDWCFKFASEQTAIHVYKRIGSSWDSNTPRTEDAKLVSSVSPNDYLGAALAISTDGGVIAAATPGYLQGQGSVNVFVRPSGGWVNGVETTRFNVADQPYTIGMTSDTTTILTGAPFAAVGPNANQGVSYVHTGTPTAPKATVSPASVSFGSQVVGTVSTPQTVTLSNTGTAPLVVTGVSVTPPFSSTTNCSIMSTIAPGASCSETVTFAPATVGAHTGTLTFTNNSGGVVGSTQVVALTGAGAKIGTTTAITTVPSGQVMVGQPVSIAFAVTPQVSTSFIPSGMVTVTANTGESCAGSVSSGSCAITFSTAGNRTVTANYNGDANFNGSTSASRPVSIVNFTLSVSPSSQSVNGRKATYTVTVTPQNGFTGAVSLGCNGGPANTTCAMAPASVTLSGAAATSKATFTLPSNAPAGSYTVNMTGQFGTVTRSTTATLIVK